MAGHRHQRQHPWLRRADSDGAEAPKVAGSSGAGARAACERLAVAAASDAAATNRRRSCPRVSHHSTARSSEQPASPSARIQGGGGATAIRLSRKLRAAGTFARAHARRSARSGNTAQLKQSRVKVFRAARAAPLLRVCRQVRRGQEVAPGAWLLKGERSVRRSSPRLHGGTTARWVSLRGQTRRRATLQSPRPCPCSSSNLSGGVPSHRGPRHSRSHRRCS